MYYYIYDNYLQEKKYQGALSKIESRLTDLGINGKITKLSLFKNLQKNINEEISRGIKTIVVVGDDRTLNQVINIVPSFSIPLAFIPVTTDSKIAKIAGIPYNEEACNILSTRIIQKVDLGAINNNYYFFTYLEMPGDNVSVNCDNNYYINIEGKNNIITISNINSDKITKKEDSQIELTIKHIEKKFLKAPKETFSYFKVKKINITSDKSIPILIVDEKRIIKNPIKLSISPKKLNLIVGKNRLI